MTLKLCHFIIQESVLQLSQDLPDCVDLSSLWLLCLSMSASALPIHNMHQMLEGMQQVLFEELHFFQLPPASNLKLVLKYYTLSSADNNCWMLIWIFPNAESTRKEDTLFFWWSNYPFLSFIFQIVNYFLFPSIK